MWIIIKVVVNTGAPPIIGVAVGPFDTKEDADSHVRKMIIGALGYEDWRVLELQKASF